MKTAIFRKLLLKLGKNEADILFKHFSEDIPARAPTVKLKYRHTVFSDPEK
jgi:hypothetical protein